MSFHEIIIHALLITLGIVGFIRKSISAYKKSKKIY